MKQLLCLLLLFFLSLPAMAQKQYTELTLRPILDSLSIKSPGYNNAVQLNVSGLPLAELVNSLALENNLNISIDPSFNQAISYNFFDAQVKDVLVFLYDNFDVEYQFVGNILAIKKPTAKKEVPLPKMEKKVDVTYNPSNEFLSVDLKNDSLYKVVQAITTLSGKNVVLAPEVRDKQVSAYFLNRPFDQVFDMIAKANGLESKKDENGFYYLFQSPKPATNNGNGSTFNPNTSNFEKTGIQITKNAFGTLDIIANNAELLDIIRAGAQECGAHYFLYNKPEGKSSFEVFNTTFPQLLELLFNGTKYSYREDPEDRVFLIGENKTEGIRVTELIRMENRTIENVKASIPKDLLTDLDVNEFLELNGLVVSGSSRKIQELKSFLSSIDVVVPMVQIDVMFITSNRNNTISSGLKAGLGDKPVTTSGSVFPAVDVTMGAQTINAILDGINGFGVLNLGNVTENFYLSMSLLESNGTVDVESTPKIATLSGHSASISIGQTTYYQETQVDVQNSVVNQGVLTSKIWKSIDANLTVKIKPFVSADEYVTLSITVTNDDFEARTDITAPPGTTKQTFESVVRVKNGEVVLLGGLEKKRKSNTGEGVPFLSRVPVLKWFFSSRERTSEKNKLHIIVRPTITY
jgi:type IV pilus assembly protein PilQ